MLYRESYVMGKNKDVVWNEVCLYRFYRKLQFKDSDISNVNIYWLYLLYKFVYYLKLRACCKTRI